MPNFQNYRIAPHKQQRTTVHPSAIQAQFTAGLSIQLVTCNLTTIPWLQLRDARDNAALHLICDL